MCLCGGVPWLCVRAGFGLWGSQAKALHVRRTFSGAVRHGLGSAGSLPFETMQLLHVELCSESSVNFQHPSHQRKKETTCKTPEAADDADLTQTVTHMQINNHVLIS